MDLSHLPARRALCVLVALCSQLGACGGESDVTRVEIALFEMGVAPSVPATAAEPADTPESSNEAPDAAAVDGPCGTGRRASYDFSSRFVPDASSVEYSSAVLSHVLIAELGEFIAGVTPRYEAGQRFAAGELVSAAGVWLEGSEQLADLELSLSLPGDPALLERRHGDLAERGSLLGLLAGSDPLADHRPWQEPDMFVGFDDFRLGRGGRTSFTPAELVRACLEQIEINAQNRAIGLFQTDPARNVLPLHLTGDGRDLAQLVRSFLLGAVAFSRGVDADLDDDIPGAGLLASTERAGAAPYSALEHAWDMGFGYFGAARDYDQGVTREDASEDAHTGAWFDTDADCFINLDSEVTFGAALRAAAAAEQGAGDFGRLAYEAFVEGRRWIQAARGTLSADQIDELVELRDRATRAWERALAATAVRALNQLVRQLDAALASSVDYSFAVQARLWSELKGTSLAFQFNRRSPLRGDDFAALHRLIGDAPRVPDTLPPTNGAELVAYEQDLRRARAALAAPYEFDVATIESW